MDIGLLIDNLLNPPILFFFLGMLAVFVKSDLDIPNPLPKFLSLYLLLSIGFQGGVELKHSGLNKNIIITLMMSLMMAALVPTYTYFILKKRLANHDAAAIASTYGSISAVTFITASSFLQRLGIPFGGYLVAAMALMESPAIIIGILLYRYHHNRERDNLSLKVLLRDALFNGSVFLITGSLLIGIVAGETGIKYLKPFTEDIFKGMLTFFLLDMGIVSAKRMSDLKRAGVFLSFFAIIVPIFNALIAIFIAKVINLSIGDALMFAVLCASASYIAVPAAIRHAIPEANPSLYVPMSLAITFPFNIVFGLPFYLFLIKTFWG
ncbi:MAG: sodium-dependent bicarbonate transport family permease [Syntrophorhabdaceae bacterium]|nr:sodium-dependent bicarbonate transport family permease [Syntrophorhabdaceae bacterium]